MNYREYKTELGTLRMNCNIDKILVAGHTVVVTLNALCLLNGDAPDYLTIAASTGIASFFAARYLVNCKKIGQLHKKYYNSKNK